MRSLVHALLAAALVAGGCATTSSTEGGNEPAAAGRNEGVAVTGSRIKRAPDEDAYGAKSGTPDKYDPTSVTRSQNPGMPAGR